MDIRAYDPFLSKSGDWPAGPVEAIDSLLDGLASADFISVNVPKAAKPLIGDAELQRVKPGVILVNTARGGVVDEAALAAALADGRVAAAGLDVFDDEPPAAGNPLLAFDQAILTPHVAGLTAQSAERMAVASVRNVLDFFAGRLDPALIVNKGFTK
jgi:D-3-phosphoglycerate dehydrogenase